MLLQNIPKLNAFEWLGYCTRIHLQICIDGETVPQGLFS